MKETKLGDFEERWGELLPYKLRNGSTQDQKASQEQIRALIFLQALNDKFKAIRHSLATSYSQGNANVYPKTMDEAVMYVHTWLEYIMF